MHDENDSFIIPTGEALRAFLIELHGAQVGEDLYQASLRNRAHAERLAALRVELEEARAVLAPAVIEAKAHLDAVELRLRSGADPSHATFEQVEAARIAYGQAKNQLRDTLAAIQAEMRQPPAGPPLIPQWQVPAWHKTEADPMTDAEISERRRQSQAAEWRNSLPAPRFPS